MPTFTAQFQVADGPAPQPHPGVSEVTLTAFAVESVEGSSAGSSFFDSESVPVGTISLQVNDPAALAALLPGVEVEVTFAVPEPPAPSSSSSSSASASASSASASASSESSASAASSESSLSSESSESSDGNLPVVEPDAQ